MAAELYDVFYQCHVQNLGWMGWAKNGDPAGTVGYAYRVEAIKIMLVKKGETAPGSADNAYSEYVAPPQPEQPESIVFCMPVDYIGIKTPYSSSHTGVDFGHNGNPNMPEIAVCDGIIEKVASDNVRGNYIQMKIDDPARNITFHAMYEHMSQIDVSAGQTVSQRQILGLMGDTGDADGAHLHFRLTITPFGAAYNDTNAEREQYCVNPLDYCNVFQGQSAGDVTAETYKAQLHYLG